MKNFKHSISFKSQHGAINQTFWFLKLRNTKN
jgi:hypothetical protein